ncbi:serine threonine-kinase ATM isoform X1 [Micractinium conductrix]|uniref:non-specific serine/threonine protein kinase n=1 Tax=Micractinium conductrix TaxID=554055 RepID=A0A2P6VAK4_9CHLO|nr:serine threonine-kinase ATM isoform X1 [Micractinium conductrix]|eukprot:PSC71129.1 serine threonine-kinase ATM isoform X1 [Micractinium conductrix]
MALPRQVKEVTDLLKGEKVAQRKDGLKRLLALLDSTDFLSALDGATAALPPGRSVPEASWPGLATALARHVTDELQAAAGRKKGPDAGLHRAFRTLVARAEEGERRSGHRRVLLRRAPALFRHVAEVLQVAGLASPLGADYTAVLRSQLLAVPEYCAVASAGTFQELITVHMDAVDASLAKGERGAEEAGRALGTLGALLAAFPGDMDPVFQDDMLSFFTDTAGTLRGIGEEAPSTATRLMGPLLSATNTYLLANGRDVAAALPALHAALYTPVLRGGARDPRLRDAAVAYLRLQLQLGTLAKEQGKLQDVVDWVEREVEQPGFKWGESSREGRLLLPKQQAALLDLAAAALFHASGVAVEAAPEGGLQEDDFEFHKAARARKRRRLAPLLSRLAERVGTAPALWAPVLARLLLCYGLALPAGAYVLWLRRLAEVAPRHCPQHFMSDEHDADSALWVLRLAHALALAWPLHLTLRGGGGGGRGGGRGGLQEEGLPPPAAVAEQWMAVWEAALGYAKSANVQASGAAAALAVLAVVARRRLVQLPPGFHRFWGLPLLAGDASQAALEFAAAAVRSGQDAEVDAASWHPALLTWLGAAPPAAAPDAAAAVLAALLRLSQLEGDTPGSREDSSGSDGGGGGPDDAPSLGVLRASDGERWWQWWQEDAALPRQLAALVRGELLMRARTLAVLAQHEAAAEAAQRAQQPAVALAPATSQDQAAEMLVKRLEGVMRRLGSPLPATTLQAQRNSQLVQLLSCVATAVAVSAAAAAAHKRLARPLPACWQPTGPLAQKLQLALQQCGGQLAEACKRLEGLFPAEEQRLRQLAAALHAYRAATGSPELGASLLSCMRSVQQLFLNAFLAVGEVVRATQAAAATRGMRSVSMAAAEALFDDDLDMAGRTTGAPRPGGTAPGAAAAPSVSSPASLVSACKTRCAALLCMLGPLDPGNASQAAEFWLSKAHEAGQVLPEEGFLLLADTLVQCCVRAMTADPAAAAKYGGSACRALGLETHGVLSWSPRYHNARCLFAVERVRAMAEAAAAAVAARGAPAAAVLRPLLVELAGVTDDAILNISEAEAKGNSGKLTGWPLRVALAQACMLLYRVDAALLAPDVLAAALQLTQGLLSDRSYAARLAGGRLVQVLLERSDDPSALFEGALLPKLDLESAQVVPKDNLAQHVETSLFALGETAACCGAAELRCLQLLVCHVAAAPDSLALAGATLDWAAARLGYPHRHAYAAWHQRPLLYHFTEAGCGLVQWQAVLRLVAPTPEAAAADGRAFLQACAPALVGTLVLCQREADLGLLALSLGTEPRALVEAHFEVLMALVFPYTVTGVPEERRRAVQLLAGGTMAGLLTAQELDALIRSRPVPVIAQLLLMARGGVEEGAAEPARPFFSGRLLVEAVHSLMRRATLEENQRALWELLMPDHLARILLALHAHLELAAHPRHQAAALAPLRAALALMGDRVCDPAAFRYTAAVLLRLLPVREMQAECCELLSGIVARMLRQRGGAEPAAVGSMLPALLSSLAEAVEADHSAGGGKRGTAATADCLLALVGQLTTGAPAGLRPFLRQVDPLPDSIPALEAPAALVAAARQDITPAEQLAQFAARASSMTPGLRRRSLAALRRVLTTQQAALFLPPCGSDSTGNASTACLPDVASAAWRLAVLSSDLGDAELAEFAGELLALAGPLESTAIAFDPKAAFSSLQHRGGGADGLPGTGGTSGSSAGPSQGAVAPPGGRAASRARLRSPGSGDGGSGGSGCGGSTTWVAALQLLGDCLVDESVEVISTAQDTLRLLLAAPEGQAALQALDPALRPYLEAFHPQSSRAPAAAATAGGSGWDAAAGSDVSGGSGGNGGGPSLESRQLWRCEQPYDAWVCQLACAMLGRASGGTLRTCRAMAQRKPAFAELLLPHAFADLATQPTNGATALQLGGLISQELLPRLHRHPKAARLLLACLNHLRSQWLDAKLAGGGGGSGGKGKGKAAAAAVAGSSSVAAEVQLWRKVYWVEVDYLELSAAAARCGAYFTALLYIEAWQEAQHGWLAPLGAAAGAAAGGKSSSSGSEASRAAAGSGDGAGEGGGGNAAAAVQRLLLDIYSSINEPDGIYAVARSHSLLSQLRRFEHEGDWSKALLSYDLVLQHLLGGGSGPAGAAASQLAAPAASQQQQPPSAPGSMLSSQAGGDRLGSNGGAHGRPASFEGVSRQAAVAGLLRSLSQLGAGHLLQAYARSPEAADSAQAAALSLGQWGGLGGGGGGLGGDSDGAQAALSSAVAGLQAGSIERCKGAVSGARRSLVAHLVTASLEGAANVNPALVQLQQLQAVSEAWELLWPALPDLGSVGSPRKRRKQQHAGSEGPAVAAAAAAAAATRALQEGVLQLWRGREASAGAGGRYNLQAPLQGMHQQLLRCMGAPDKQADSLVSGAVAARKSDHFAQATTSLYQLRALLQAQAAAGDGGLPDWAAAMSAPDASWRVEEAKQLWAQGQHDTAVQLARSLLAARPAQSTGGSGSSSSDAGGDAALRSAYLRALAAKWLSRTRSESPSAVLNLMQEAADQAQGSGQGGSEAARTACRVLYRLAHYADGLYRGIEAQKASAEYKTAKAVIDAKRQQIEQWSATLEERKRRGDVKIDRKTGQILDREARQLAHMITTTRRPVDMDEAEQRLLDEKERQFLHTALLNYTRCLASGDAYDLRVVFRIVQLWLRLGQDREVNRLVGAAFRSVPSHKFLPLVYQVASRMSAAKSDFQANLVALLVRLGTEHPHHTLYQIFSLKNGNRGRDGRVASTQANEAFSYAVDHDKVAAAQEVLSRVAAASPACAAIVKEMGELIDGYIDLAATPPPSKDAEEMAFPGGLRRSRQNYQHLPVTSVTLPVDPSGRYEGFPHFVAFAERIKFVGGINKPKIVSVADSEGRQHRQLVKSGNDDMRQDAVMQQFFWLVNQFLRQEERTARRALFIRTYKVVPFSPSSGLLEWVEHTLPMADYLLGPNRAAGAHARYRRRGAYTWTQCYSELVKTLQSQPKPEQLRAAFEEVCARFPPAMHHFFLENFRDPGTWFERRLAYTRSMAVNSMAGHIIGLGDRHLQNLLLDTRSADAVHIDLGIAFEQGRFLNTPELVPFRLTRDVIDGMGITGVEGVMRRCCEETLRVLRANKESILTVIEVFIHDPLYKWALTTTAANRRQHEADAGDEDIDGGSGVSAAAGAGGPAGLANADAERTLLRIKQKLEGVEAGEGEARGVEGQVQQLLADAADPDKLCRMYIGWQAWV